MTLLISCQPHTTNKSHDKNNQANLKADSISILITSVYCSNSDFEFGQVFDEVCEKEIFFGSEIYECILTYIPFSYLVSDSIVIKPEDFISLRVNDSYSHSACAGELSGCNVCEGNLFALYHSYMKQRPSAANYSNERGRLILIFANLISLYEFLSGGGSVWAKEMSRATAYTEYYLYLLSTTKLELSVEQNFDERKKIFFDGFRNGVIKHFNDLEKEFGNIEDVIYLNKENALNRSAKIIDKLSELIVNELYLNCLIKFIENDSEMLWELDN